MDFDEKSDLTEMDASALEPVEDEATGARPRSLDDDESEFARRGTPTTVVASTSTRLLEAETERARWAQLGGNEGWGLGPTKPEIEAPFAESPEPAPPPEPTTTLKKPWAAGPAAPAALAATSPRLPTLLGYPTANPAPVSPGKPALRALPSLRLPGASGSATGGRASSERSVPAVSVVAAPRAGSASRPHTAGPHAWGYGPLGYLIVGVAGLLGILIGLAIRTRTPTTAPAAAPLAPQTAAQPAAERGPPRPTIVPLDPDRDPKANANAKAKANANAEASAAASEASRKASEPQQLSTPGREEGILRIRTDPPAALITVDRKRSLGPSPQVVKVRTGRWIQITARLAGHKPSSRRIYLQRADASLRMRLQPL